MRRRLVTLLLTVLVAAGGVALASCPPGQCAAMQAEMTGEGHAAMQHGVHAGMPHAMQQPAATAHDCCERDGITRARGCCPDTVQLAQQQATPSAERASHDFELAAAQPVPTSLAAVATATTDPPRRVPLGAPPGTLITQHTSLLV